MASMMFIDTICKKCQRRCWAIEPKQSDRISKPIGCYNCNIEVAAASEWRIINALPEPLVCNLCSQNVWKQVNGTTEFIVRHSRPKPLLLVHNCI